MVLYHIGLSLGDILDTRTADCELLYDFLYARVEILVAGRVCLVDDLEGSLLDRLRIYGSGSANSIGTTLFLANLLVKDEFERRRKLIHSEILLQVIDCRSIVHKEVKNHWVLHLLYELTVVHS